MNIQVNNMFYDSIQDVLSTCYDVGSQLVNKIPCSICRKNKELKLDCVRTHFHGSDFGSCKRKVYYEMVTGEKSTFSNIVFLNDGHLHEEAIMNNIRLGLGEGFNRYKLVHFKEDKETNNHTGEFAYEDEELLIVNHLDGTLFDLVEDKQYLIECKSVKQSKYKEIKTDGKIPDQWYGQIQSYLNLNNLMLGNIDTAYLYVKHRESSLTLKPIKINKDEDYINTRLAVLGDILDRVTEGLDQPDREHLTAKDSECLYCPFKERCWNT